ncbi:MAG: J domain-containing protein [Pseudomonadota bacterium]|nr:J domain-containing protein [Pseudomonadota bacterium]
MAKSQRDYYEVLGIARDADHIAIKEALRELAMKYHPDRNKSPDAEEKFKEIAEAYAVQSDPKKRTQYDHSGFAGVADLTPEDLFGGIDFGDLFGDMGFGFDFGGGGVFDRLFRHRRQGPALGQDLAVSLVGPLERINSGGDETVRFTRAVSCPTCSGSGAKPGTKPRSCESCGGSGRRVITRDQKQDKGNIHFQQITVCPACRGRGSFIDHPCGECHGSGQVEKEESLKVHIPAGLEEATPLRIREHGMPSKEAGGPPGDLFVVVSSAPDSRSERVGADLWRRETLEIADAVLGTRLKVPTLEGDVDVKVPPGTQPDEVLRLRGKGLQQFGGGGHGDLNLRIQVQIPEKLSAEERALYEQLRSLGQTGTQKKRWWQ